MFEDYLSEALDIVSAWDLPDDEVIQVANAQARLMAGLSAEYAVHESPPSPYCALQF